jgi:hypothetical protein
VAGAATVPAQTAATKITDNMFFISMSSRQSMLSGLSSTRIGTDQKRRLRVQPDYYHRRSDRLHELVVSWAIQLRQSRALMIALVNTREITARLIEKHGRAAFS